MSSRNQLLEEKKNATIKEETEEYYDEESVGVESGFWKSKTGEQKFIAIWGIDYFINLLTHSY